MSGLWQHDIEYNGQFGPLSFLVGVAHLVWLISVGLSQDQIHVQLHVALFAAHLRVLDGTQFPLFKTWQ